MFISEELELIFSVLQHMPATKGKISKTNCRKITHREGRVLTLVLSAADGGVE